MPAAAMMAGAGHRLDRLAEQQLPGKHGLAGCEPDRLRGATPDRNPG